MENDAVDRLRELLAKSAERRRAGRWRFVRKMGVLIGSGQCFREGTGKRLAKLPGISLEGFFFRKLRLIQRTCANEQDTLAPCFSSGPGAPGDSRGKVFLIDVGWAA
jgi:hypothetical protein